MVYYLQDRYTLDNLPENYGMDFGPMSVFIKDGAVRRIDTQSPSYTLANGLRAGVSEDKVKEVFGAKGGAYLTYEDKGISFEVHEKDRTVTEIHTQYRQEPASHGCMAASIAVGRTVGVAPEAELYFVAPYRLGGEEAGIPTLQYLARGIHRILEIDEQLPQDGKIRVISISNGWTQSDGGDGLITEATQRARAAGMLVVCTAVELVHDGCDYDVLGRSPLMDPDGFESYEPALFAAESFWAGHESPSEGTFFVPVDSRTTASDEGIDEYVFDRGGGSSKAPPYIAGVYALAVQVDPDITPRRFWALAARTDRTIELEREGMKRPLGPIIDPVGLIRRLSGGLKQQPNGR